MISMNMKVSRRWLFWGLFSIFALFLILRYMLMIYFSSLIFVAILAMIAFVGDRDEILATCVCCIPLSMTFQYYYVIAICMVMYLCKYGKDIRLNFSFVPILLIIIWELGHCFSDNTSPKEWIVMMIPYMLLVWLFSARNIQSVDYNLIVRSFSAMVLCLCVVLLGRLFILSDYNINTAFLNMQRLGLNEENVNELVINPNSLGIWCVLAASGLNQLRMNRVKRDKKAGDVILMVMILVLGALTISRTYLACLIIMFAYIFMISKGIKKKAVYLGGFAVISIVGLVLLYILFPAVLEFFGYRLQLDDITGGRGALFAQYNDYLLSSPRALLWGTGSLRMKEKVVFQDAIASNVPHNGIQEILVAWGIPVLILFIALVFAFIRSSRRENPKQMAINYLPLLIIFVKIQVGQLVTSPYTLLAMAFAYISLCQNFSTCTGQSQTDYGSVNPNTD